MLFKTDFMQYLVANSEKICNFTENLPYRYKQAIITMEHNCPQCPLRAKYDQNPKSLLGRIWRWHINFCPGFKAYFASLQEEEQQYIRKQYNITKY